MNPREKVIRRRPEMQLYKPGMGKLLGRRTDVAEEAVAEGKSSVSDKKENRKTETVVVKEKTLKSEISNVKPEHYQLRSHDDQNTTETKSGHQKNKKKRGKSNRGVRSSTNRISNLEPEVGSLKCDSEERLCAVKDANILHHQSVSDNQRTDNQTKVNRNFSDRTKSRNRKSMDFREVVKVNRREEIVKSDNLNRSYEERKETKNNEKIKSSPGSTFKNFKTEKTKPKRFSNKQEAGQLPPRFLKLQMKKMTQNEQTRYFSERPDNQDSRSKTFNRGIIRLPPHASNQVFADDQESFGFDTNSDITSQVNNALSKISLSSNKPCVAIRPTPHISMPFSEASEMFTYSSSSSPDVNTSKRFQYPMYVQTRSFSPTSFTNYPMSSTEAEMRLSCEMTKKPMKSIVEKNFGEAFQEEKELQSVISKSKDFDLTKVEQHRYKIQLRYERIILTDLRFCAEKNIEQLLWKVVFYQFIEMFRKKMENFSDCESAKSSLLKIIDESSLFFENLLVKLQDTYYFNIDTIFENGYDQNAQNYELIKLATISAQKIYLYLGDLARYKEQSFNKASNFAKARSFYLKAQRFFPKNGRPYNQLALIAMYEKRRLEAVYYYMRSLAASNSIQTARENLLAIFDEVRKKYESAERKRKNEQRESIDTLNEERLEIWIRPDGTSANIFDIFEENDNKDEEELDLLSTIDLNKRFVLSFLHVHGKLFTKIGMESFISTVNQMLLDFFCLLKRSPTPFSSERMLQLLGINMFSVFYTSLKDSSYGPDCRSLLQEHAIQVTFAMMSLILNCVTNFLKDYSKRDAQPNFQQDDISEFLPTIKIWTDWMSCQKHLWTPPPQPLLDLKTRCIGDIWSMFAKFLTELRNFNCRSVNLLPTRLEGCETILLPEDSFLAGFYPLLGAPHCSQFAQPPYDKEKARACLRITVIQFFGDYLCGITKPYLKFDVEHKKFISLVSTSTVNPVLSKFEKESHFLDTWEDETEDNLNKNNAIKSDEFISENEKTDLSSEQIEIQMLWSRQEALKKLKKQQENIEQKINAILSEEDTNKNRLVIQPKYIIPDTNCLIDYLDEIKSLLNLGKYEIVIPLIVINELNGLMSRKTIVTSQQSLVGSEDHQEKVGIAAKMAIEFLNRCFKNKHPLLKTVTSKGTLLDTMNFTSESSDAKNLTNDDLVLGCCIQFIKEGTSNKCFPVHKNQKGETVNVFREVVLLTEDRNLRVKALCHKVPVKSLPVFMKWAC